jgi:outer membrane protein insertion porin family
MTATRFLPCKNIVYPLVAVLLFLFSSCGVVPKNYPVNKPFVFDYTVKVEGLDTSADYISTLENRLSKQLDDSIKVRTVRKFISKKGFFLPILNRPPLYNPENVDKSKIYMRALLTSMGYFKDSIADNIKIDTVNADQYRTTINFIVMPGKQVIIDSLSYNLSKPELQQLALANRDTNFVKEGGAFAKANVSAELDRLTELYRNNGYLRFGREDLYGLWDTLDVSLLRPALDPFEQLELLKQLQLRREKPTANLEFRLKPAADSLKHKKYYIGDIIVYPDYSVDRTDSSIVMADSGTRVISYYNMFKPKIFPENIYLKKGDLYDQRNYYRTVNRLNSLGSWRLINVKPSYRRGNDTADFIIQMTPALKYSFTTNLEGSGNNNALAGNFIGLGVNANLQTRNFAKAANQANTYIRFGIELGKDQLTKKYSFLQTFQLSAGHSISFPRPIFFPKNLIGSDSMKKSFKTILALTGAITNRRGLYNYNTVNLSFGWDFQTFKKKPILHTIKPFNIEYSDFIKQPGLDAIFISNPSLARIFTDGLISSVIYSGKKIIEKGRAINVIKLGVESAGLLPGFIKKNDFLDTNLYRFIKADLEFIRKINLKKNVLALRFFIGVGYEHSSTINEKLKYNLPFIRQYFAGGPNSMRAWGLRKLGPGSLLKNFDATGIPDRYGDFQLEANAEYRFKAFKLAGIPVNGAVFSDIGNIWYIKDLPDNSRKLDNSLFNINRLGKDIAVGVGVGARVDFSFLVIRLDVSHKVKDPSPSFNNQTLQNKIFGYVEKHFWQGTQFQLGISYPFIL